MATRNAPSSPIAPGWELIAQVVFHHESRKTSPRNEQDLSFVVYSISSRNWRSGVPAVFPYLHDVRRFSLDLRLERLARSESWADPDLIGRKRPAIQEITTDTAPVDIINTLYIETKYSFPVAKDLGALLAIQFAGDGKQKSCR